MAHVAVVGGGPAGLSAALFLAKNGLDVTVYDTDETWMHKAHLFNYPGIDSLDGDAYIEVAREQATRFGAELHLGEEVTAVSDDGGLAVTTGEDEYDANYVVLATGANRDLAEDLGCDTTEEGAIAADVTMETSVDGVYATGAMVRTEEWQAIISAGDGAAAALNILSRERGEHFHDFDTPADIREAFATLVDEG
ncbi:FAD-dependent oxidoreductase [Halorarum halophilum]|uniref:FAD-dependent oxidoreductase n=1 Tax=Halorarum halophilum TaxID=2743090 RepID=A0A7D5GYD4_9EURY|nr:FAD-dependent oxidoreductase [Halobaculum halophilum]QLG26773.1 FAD-dependent oxidoreductase [Halobaculum halophilum]